ncbi:MAG: undecaprenyldiphospho-muramoylpentapeptide beta-N-acetylglucosaminyltransferase [Betaproteobacteria bacterium]|nr:undecaprenyldiphospho-muramoylpentapeptide beta-N-acetylglucosaminyltransferase [Betaproteobacteria bacterium]MCC7219025.1 undecaprenyldiphospho-muramoylpentapeptide beta-N-acetylglucosaminyltransferase [Burkholderiales bacterium]
MTGTAMITTGGTGGHIFPGIAVAGELARRGWHVFWLGTRDGMEGRLVPQHGIDFEGIAFRSVRGKGPLRLLVGPFAILAACVQAFRVLGRRRPSVVIGFGGFASFPGALMAVARNIPLVVHNLDAKPGLANRVLRFGADRVLTGFPGVLGEGRDPRVEWVGNPLRADIVAALPPEERFAGRSGPLTVLVVGGSLGAVALNECVPRALALMPPGARPVVTHQAGEKHIDALVAEYERAGVAAECVAFIADMGRRYAEADVVIARSGATTVAELAAVGAASVLVPYPHAADDHQVDNARQLADRGAAVLILQRDLSPEGLAAWLGSVTRGQLLAMAQAARALRRADAVARVADVCIELGSRQ